MRRQKLLIPVLTIVICCAGLARCGSGGPGSPSSDVASVVISAPQASIPVSGMAAFTAVAKDSSGNVVAGASIMWQSQTPATATINASTGVAMGLFPGATQIIASANGVTSEPTTLTVTPGFLVTGSLATAEFDATETLLGNGRVLIAAGYNSTTGTLDGAELYDPTKGVFTATGNLITPRYWAEACLLNNGKVLVAGGYNADGFVGSAELYDPATGVFSATGNMVVPRRLFAMTPLQNGSVLVTGGFGASGALQESEVYDPNAGMFSVTGQLNSARRVTAATLLNNGMVLVTGGFNGGGVLASAELYDPTTGAFTYTGNMNESRYYHSSTLLSDGRVLTAGGESTVGVLEVPLASAEIYDPTTAVFTLTSNLNAARYDHTATLLGNGMVVIAGGFEPPAALGSAELFDPGTGIFSFTGNLNVARGNQTAVLLKNGTVLVAGGGDANNDSLASAELYEIGP
jgi:Kelch motif protein/galactose oxidase-like protein